MRVLVCAGGTGGGIYPALTAVSALRDAGVETDDILWIGTAGEMEETLVPRAGLTLQTIRGGAIAGVSVLQKLRNGARLAASVFTAIGILRRFRPQVMLMTGGYMSVPVAIAARLLRIPIVVFLPDVEPGAAIKFLMPLVTRVACTSADSQRYVPAAKMMVTGYPVRQPLRAATHMTRTAALAQFDLTAERPTFLVFGGSRGSLNINRSLMQALPQLLPHMQIIHISGTLTWPEVEENRMTLPESLGQHYRAFPYLHEEMGAAFRAADLVLTRAGASMLGEGPAFGVPSILVPLAWAWRYQKVNADYLVQRGAALQLTDETLAAEIVPVVRELLQDEARLTDMRTAAQSLDRPDAVAQLARVIMDCGRLPEDD